MVIESKSKQKKRSPNLGGARPNAGRKPLFDDYPETVQKMITLPAEFWTELQQAYSEHGRSWASVGVYEILEKWRSEEKQK